MRSAGGLGARLIGDLHDRHVAGRRVRRLADRIATLLPPAADVLDIGCGDGTLACEIVRRRADVTIRGLDVLVRPGSAIPVEPFDGVRVPLDDSSVSAALLVDVLHHAVDPMTLLREACRVAREAVIIKDHLRDPALGVLTLRLMDWVGNARHGVALPYTYWSRREWQRAFRDTGLVVEQCVTALRLYPMPASLMFDRALHFIALLRPPGALRSGAGGR